MGSNGNIYTVSRARRRGDPGERTRRRPDGYERRFTALAGESFGVDFNPTVDRLRVVSDSGQNLRINVDTGLVTTDTDLNPLSPSVVASAYTNNFAGATTTQLFGIDAESNQLVQQVSPNDGTIVPIGTGLGFDVAEVGALISIPMALLLPRCGSKGIALTIFIGSTS